MSTARTDRHPFTPPPTFDGSAPGRACLHCGRTPEEHGHGLAVSEAAALLEAEGVEVFDWQGEGPEGTPAAYRGWISTDGYRIMVEPGRFAFSASGRFWSHRDTFAGLLEALRRDLNPEG